MTALRQGIVAGYDGSPGAREALRWAVEEARLRRCRLTVCLAWAPQYLTLINDAAVYDLARQRGEEILATGLRDARSRLDGDSVVPLLVRGSAVPVLCELTATAEMVVLGARGHGGVAGLALGSVPGQVAGHARGPLVVVRGQWRPPNRAPGPVVAGADGSAASDGVLRFAFLEAELRRVPLVALCALADAPGTLGGTRRVEEEFLAVLEPHEKENPEVTVTRRISAGSPRRMLLDAATGAQLLVVGSRGRGGLSGMTVGSVAHAALHHSPCPIAVIPALSPRGRTGA